MSQKVIILRGIPGCGKTSKFEAFRLEAHKERPGAVILSVSADHFFIGPGPEYKYTFDPKRIKEAHAMCLRRYIGLVVNRTPFDAIVVDNTNISEAEIAPYYAIAQAYGVEVEIWTIFADPTECAKRNVHGVPEDVVHKMAARLNNPLPPWWVNKEIGKNGDKESSKVSS